MAANFTMSNAARSLMADAVQTDIAAGTLTIRSGAAPGPNNTATGTVLATVTLPNPAVTESNGVLTLTGTWSDASADATGTAAHFRIVGAVGVYEGTVGTATSDMIVTTTSFVVTQPFSITAFSLTFGISS